ncbi:TetR/AcrR family transcriptional regulator [Novosphingobium sp. KCTC 2891]|uniref:TetR/AcrR family transcriptional regulator n=1 Tax=Novosphingobium sp. KCTC 2891 TaxID=2989730 RepID=UPI002222BF9F|nr:TetR/AcrR family transcriptional regulator [Novosphingobium sp. KCTC 2891]MCW1382470.1 TetR/AcrR family transcriptional regulator [Novosphingobium sp. KCTC 2891]
MIPNRAFRPAPVTARDKLLEAAVKLVRRQGFAGTSVEQLCGEAGVTKGAFFHHFASKEALGVAAAEYWSASTGAFFAEAPFHHLPDPVDRVLGYIDLRIALIGGPAESFSCVAGTLVQEAFRSSAAIRVAAESSIMGNARALEADLDAAVRQCGIEGTTGASLARHVQAVIQGAFVLAKTQPESGAADLAREQLAHLRRYFVLLFGRDAQEE